MADIVNARDVLLQATAPRILPVNLPPNVSVPVDQVPGLGDVYTATRSLELRTTSQLFQIPNVGAITPASITITALLKNITGLITWEVIDGEVEYTTNGNQMTVVAGGLITDTATIKATVVFNSTSYSDTLTLANLHEGTSSVVGLLTNESALVPADSNGVVGSYAGAGGTYRVYYGLNDVTGTGVTYSVASATEVSVTINQDGVYTVSNLTSATGTAILRAVYNGVTIDKVYSIAKARPGADGKDGKDGQDGQRGTVNIAGAITGSIWLDAEAEAVLAANGYGEPKVRDIVTLYNLATGFSESRYYNGTGWLTLDAYVNGNMLVTGTVTTEKLAADSVTAEKINVTDLSAISANLGEITAGSISINGKFIVSSDGTATIRSGTSGQRTETDNSGTRVYDANGVLRVRLGVW